MSDPGIPRPDPGLALIVDDEQCIVRLLTGVLGDDGWRCVSAGGIAEARELLGSKSPDLLLTDLYLPTGSGLDLAAWARARDPHLGVILMTGFASLSSVLQAMSQGVFDYWVKPFSDLSRLRARALAAGSAAAEARAGARIRARYVAERGGSPAAASAPAPFLPVHLHLTLKGPATAYDRFLLEGLIYGILGAETSARLGSWRTEGPAARGILACPNPAAAQALMAAIEALRAARGLVSPTLIAALPQLTLGEDLCALVGRLTLRRGGGEWPGEGPVDGTEEVRRGVAFGEARPPEPLREGEG